MDISGIGAKHRNGVPMTSLFILKINGRLPHPCEREEDGRNPKGV